MQVPQQRWNSETSPASVIESETRATVGVHEPFQLNARWPKVGPCPPGLAELPLQSSCEAGFRRAFAWGLSESMHCQVRGSGV